MSAAEHNWAPLVEEWPRLGNLLGTKLSVVRDDLLPFPLAGNKVRKIAAEIESLQQFPDVIISNGSVDSNHSRTVATFAARYGAQAHLVLHGDDSGYSSVGAKVLRTLGATFDIGPASTIRERIEAAHCRFESQGKGVHVIAGGCHTRAGALAFRDAGMRVLGGENFDQVFVASGTGATQGGLVAAAAEVSPSTRVVGISVARDAQRGVPPVAEASMWAGASGESVTFLDQYRAGGYGLSDSATNEAVRLGWSHGLPLDPTYTGKAFAALVDWSRRGQLGSSVLFWHTGGLWNWLAQP